VSYTYAILEVSPATYAEVRRLLEAAGYQHAFHRDGRAEVIDMHGIALRAAASSDASLDLASEDRRAR